MMMLQKIIHFSFIFLLFLNKTQGIFISTNDERSAHISSPILLFDASNQSDFDHPVDQSENFNFYAQGKELFDRHNFKEAAECFTKAIVRHPNSAVYLRNRALCYFNMKEWNLAAVDYNKALEIDSNNVRSHFYLCMTLFGLHDYDKAMEHFDKAIHLAKAMGMPDSEINQVTAKIEEARKRIFVLEEAKKKSERMELWYFLEKLLEENLQHEIKNLGSYSQVTKRQIIEKYKNDKRYISEIFAEPGEKQKTREIPDYLRDPITSALLKEPVITAEGVTYEKETILQKIGKDDSTTKKHQKLIPNYTLKEVIASFLEANKWQESTLNDRNSLV